MTAPIVLMTDFGRRDSYVGVMKGLIAGSDNFLEFAVRNGNAAQGWNVGLGVEVLVMRG